MSPAFTASITLSATDSTAPRAKPVVTVSSGTSTGEPGQ